MTFPVDFVLMGWRIFIISPDGLIPNDYRPEKKKGKRKKADASEKNGKPKRQGRRKRYQLSILPACGVYIPLPFCPQLNASRLPFLP
jgi:hypothetical protein